MKIDFKLKMKKVISKCFWDDFDNYSRRYEVYYGGAGSGKSWFVAMKIIYKLLTSKRRCLIVRKFGTSIRQSTWALFSHILKEWELFCYCEVKESYLLMKLPNGSELIFTGLDDVEKVKSILDISDIVCEEATELQESDYNQLNLRLRAKTPYNQLIVMFNPVSKLNWVYPKFFQSIIDVSTTLIHKTTYIDNDFLQDDYRKTVEEYKTSNPLYWRVYGLGEFIDLDGISFPEFSEDVHTIEPFEIPTHWLKWVSIDNGYSDPFAFYWYALDETGTIYVYREFTRDVNKQKLTYKEQATKCVALTGLERIQTNVVGHDAFNKGAGGRDGENKTLIDYYQQGGLYNFTKANTDRKLGKITLHEYLKPLKISDNKYTAKVKIFKTCYNLIRTIPLLINDEKDHEKVEGSTIDHWYDSFRYGLIFSHSLKSRPPEPPKTKKLKDILDKRNQNRR